MRGKKAPSKTVQPDFKYGSTLVGKLINKVMRHGKKSKAEKIVYDVLEELSSELKDKPVNILEKAIANVKPSTEVRSRRIGGATYQVPVAVSPSRQVTLAIRWIVDAVRKKGGIPMVSRLKSEIRDAYKGNGEAVKVREQVERMAEANKAFAQFRW